MPKQRMEAFTDAIFAIIITVIVLELHAPASGKFSALWSLRHTFAIYLASFLILAVYWNNHHHLFQIVRSIDGVVLWANTIFILFISLFPFATAWVGDNHVDSVAPEMLFGTVMLLMDAMFFVLVRTLIHADGENPEIRKLVGKGYNKPYISMIGNLAAIFLALVWPPLTVIVDTLLLLLWVLPERRIERHVANGQ
ncbi:DUF1211 domain-containing protein [Schleiferilactobacillus harbinensis]|uniref:TMEM175 family protein n=1 Tax=Schleiferilactobacillus harbinensis TaxID=304207 RepID=UPI0021A546AE|nr:TMEM175 family protein [Schleiferilactobacillus harbinensis]MCT2908700.1 DUF1211 domain-containing protein [Schleiferilactobacillus harbinensis]